MNGKSLLIPIAAFALTVTGAQAFSTDVLEKAGLSEEQISAFEEAKELREEGDKDGARDILAEAGVDQDTMESIRQAMKEEHHAHKTAVDEAVEAGDYEAFKDAIQDSPLADIITSEADFELFVEAHEHREAARAIMEELGLEKGERGQFMGHHKGHFKMNNDEVQ